jgi:hypothetical protein
LKENPKFAGYIFKAMFVKGWKYTWLH